MAFRLYYKFHIQVAILSKVTSSGIRTEDLRPKFITHKIPKGSEQVHLSATRVIREFKLLDK